MIDIPYIKEIRGLEWAREVISERFQNATEIMTPRSVIYGGAIRDAIAGIELVGDLDIAVPNQEKEDIVNRFLEDPRWRARNVANSPWARVTAAGYDQPVRERIPMQDIIEFVTFKDAIAQIMVSNLPGKDPFFSAVGMAKQVDFRCCSMILTFDGRIFETIEGGLEDCQNRVLRINEESTTIHLDTIQSRVEKLVKRGWTNMVDVEATIERVKAQRAKEERDRIRKHAALRKKHENIFEASKMSSMSMDSLRHAMEVKESAASEGYYISVNSELKQKFSAAAINESIGAITELSEGSPLIHTHFPPDGSLLFRCKSTLPLIKFREHLIRKNCVGGNLFGSGKYGSEDYIRSLKSNAYMRALKDTKLKNVVEDDF